MGRSYRASVVNTKNLHKSLQNKYYLKIVLKAYIASYFCKIQNWCWQRIGKYNVIDNVWQSHYFKFGDISINLKFESFKILHSKFKIFLKFVLFRNSFFFYFLLPQTSIIAKRKYKIRRRVHRPWKLIFWQSDRYEIWQLLHISYQLKPAIFNKDVNHFKKNQFFWLPNF